MNGKIYIRHVYTKKNELVVIAITTSKTFVLKQNIMGEKGSIRNSKRKNCKNYV